MSVLFVDDWKRRFPNFAPSEILSPGTLRYPHMVDFVFLSRLQEFRDALGLPLLVNHGGHKHRGVRTPHEQDEIMKVYGGAPLSMHVCGKAADISCPTMKPGLLFNEARLFGFRGIGLYDTFVHVDDRTLFSPVPVIWNKSNN
jgi:hypothetical protein